MGTYRRIFVWRGYHSQDFYSFFKFCWDNNHLLICCPPVLHDLSFLRALPSGEIQFCGHWDDTPPRVVQEGEGTPYPDKPVLGVFTTGSSRDHAKLVLFSKQNITSCHAGILKFFTPERITGIFCYPQPYHVFGLLLGYALSHDRKLRLSIPHGPYSSRHHQARVDLNEDRILTLMTPTHTRDLVSFLQTTSQALAPSYSCILGGAKVTVNDWKLARNRLKMRRPSIGYGCTEASPGITHLPPGHQPSEDGDIGYPLDHLDVGCLADGGIRCRGASIAMATIEQGFVTFPRELIVNDHLEQAEDGRLVFRSRTDIVLNRGGEKFALERIESVLRHSLDLETICVALPHERLGEELGILVKANIKKKPTLERISSALLENLGREFADLTMTTTQEDLPVNAHAKLDRRAAADLLRSSKHG